MRSSFIGREEKIKKLQKYLDSLPEIPSSLLIEFKSFIVDSITKINKWNDKIIEIISYFLSKDTYITECKNIYECNKIISIIIDIINSFINNPNIMLYEEKPTLIDKKDKYNIIKIKIYNLFLKLYKIKLDNKDLKHPLYVKLKKENEDMIIVLQNMKLDDCKNIFLQEEINGGKNKYNLKKNRKIKNYKK